MQKKIKLSEKLMEKHGKIRYRFMNAYLFATVFQKNQEALKDLIAALLRIELKEIVSLEILNPILPGQDIAHKSCIMDILVLLNGNIRVNLEMQVLDEGNWNERGVYYLAENLLDLKKGEDYKNLKTTVQIGILDFDLWKFGKNPFYQVYELWDTEHDRVFTNKMKLCVLSLRQAEKAEERVRQSGLYDWAKTLTAETWEELQELSEKNEKINGCTTLRLPNMADPEEYGVALKVSKPSKIQFIYPGAKLNGCEDDIDLMLDAFNSLSEEEKAKVVFHITGTTEEQLKSKIKNPSVLDELKDVVIVHSWMEYSDLIALYKQMDYLVLARFDNELTRANFPSKIPENMCYGIVPICSKVGDYTTYYLKNMVDSIFCEVGAK